jgi:2-hydroxychromene-2-carboxylate isomerase
MSDSIEFYFDFSSPYGFLASERIEPIATRLERTVLWRPVLLGAIFRVTGQGPLIEIPLKGDYAKLDFARSAREHKVDYHHPANFPVGAVLASRATLWLRDNPDPELQSKTAGFIHAIYRAYFSRGRDISDAEVILAEAEALGIDAQALQTAAADQRTKDALRAEVDQAIALGIFGSPTMQVDGERFWGHDRLEQMERWVKTGGW